MSVEMNEWIDLPPERDRQAASQLQQADSMLLGVVTELVDAQNVAVAIDGVGDAQADVVCPGSGRMWVGARVRCIRDSTGRVVRVEAVAVDELPDEAETRDMDATTQWISHEQAALDARQGETANALDEARSDLDAAQAQLDDPVTGLDAAQAKADDAAANAALAQGSIPFIQQATPSAVVVGQLWFPTDPSGRVIGMKVSTATGAGGWQDYRLMAGQILVPGTVGTTEIGPDGVTAPNIKASSELSAKIASFLEVTTQQLIAGGAKITGELLADVLKVLTRIVAGNPDGTAAELDPFGLHVYRKLLDGTRAEVARFGTDASDDYLGVLDATGNTLASIDDEGNGSFQAVDAGDSLVYQGDELGDILTSLARGTLVKVKLANDVNIGSTLARIVQGTAVVPDGDSGRQIQVTLANSAVRQSNLTRPLVFEVRVQKGETISTSAAPQVYFVTEVSTTSDNCDTFTYSFNTDEMGLVAGDTFTVGVHASGAAGSTVTISKTLPNSRTGECSLTVSDMGASVPTEQVNGTSTGGSSSGSVSKTTRTVTAACTWGQSYKIDGSITTGMDPYAVQGSGGGSARMSMLGFQDLTGYMSGATINKVEVYVYFAHWWNNSGGTASIGYHGSASKPSTWGGTGWSLQVGGIPKPGGKWITLPSSTYAQWKSGAYRGINFRAPNDSTAAIYYGYAVPSKCKLRVTYTK